MVDITKTDCVRCGGPNPDFPEYGTCAACRGRWDHLPPPPPERPRAAPGTRSVQWFVEQVRRDAERKKLRCRHCGEPLAARRLTRKFCGVTCRVAHWRSGRGGRA